MLELKGLTKRFGETTAVDDLSFAVRPGEIFGLLGANGAGKTTTLRMLSTMLTPSAGTASICEFDLIANSSEVRSHVGIMFGGETGLYDRLSARENIMYFARLNAVPEAEANERIEGYAKAFSFPEYLDTWAGKLSKGTRQKIAFCRSIAHNPEIMLFDEPFLGLDVSSRKEAEDFVLACRDQGKAIVLSDHVLPTIEKLCGRVGILSKGKLLEIGTIEELTQRNGCANLEEVFMKRAGKEAIA